MGGVGGVEWSRPGRFVPGKEPTRPPIQEAGWTPEPIWAIWRREHVSCALPGFESRIVRVRTRVVAVRKNVYSNDFFIPVIITCSYTVIIATLLTLPSLRIVHTLSSLRLVYTLSSLHLVHTLSYLPLVYTLSS